jgi:glycosyltransferase involved in cell wall biosynthesis
MKILCILWGPFGHRMDELAKAVGGERLSVTVLYGPRYFAPLRYPALFLLTLVLLHSRRPDVVYAQNPPVFCPLTSLIYCRLHSKRLVVDHHAVWRAKTVGGPVGGAIGLLESFVASAADGNTAPHAVWGRELARMGARRLAVVHDHVQRNVFGRDESVRKSFGAEGMLAIASHGGHPLERLESEVAAASMRKDLTLVITGPEAKLKSRLPPVLPQNVRYAGMLPIEVYLKLKASADFALNITDEPNTLSHVLFEYAASSLPVISTRSDVVESVFGDSLLYSDSSRPGDVSRAIERILQPGVLSDYRSRISALYSELERRHSKEVSSLISVVRGELLRNSGPGTDGSLVPMGQRGGGA